MNEATPNLDAVRTAATKAIRQGDSRDLFNLLEGLCDLPEYLAGVRAACNMAEQCHSAYSQVVVNVTQAAVELVSIAKQESEAQPKKGRSHGRRR